MPYKPRIFVLSLLAIFVLAISPMPAAMQDTSTPDLSEMYNTTVTLYYYDNASQTKGAFVDMPDNPQYVNADPAMAAPGMYTFSQVPSGQWYYLEADHQGNKWYTIFFMGENIGTKTANVHIPPMQPVNVTATAAATPMPPIDTPPPVPSLSLTPTPAPVATPGMTPAAAMLAGVFAIALAGIKR